MNGPTMKNIDIQVPTVHMNGTSRDALQEFNDNARRAVAKAIDAVEMSAPHGRDFYPQGEGAFSKACTEHKSRIERLRSVLRELDELSIALVEE